MRRENQRMLDRQILPIFNSVQPQLAAALGHLRSPLVQSGLRSAERLAPLIKQADATAHRHADAVRLAYQVDSVQRTTARLTESLGKETLRQATRVAETSMPKIQRVCETVNERVRAIQEATRALAQVLDGEKFRQIQQATKTIQSQIAPVLERARPQMEAILRHRRVCASRAPRRPTRIRATAPQRSSSSGSSMPTAASASTLACCDPGASLMGSGELPPPSSDAPSDPRPSRAHEAHRETLASVCTSAGRARAPTSPTSNLDAPSQRCTFSEAQRARGGASFFFHQGEDVMNLEHFELDWVAVDRLFCSPTNPRRNDAAVPHVVASLQRFGWQQPIVAKTSGEVIAGNTRLKAAKELGMSQVPVVWFEASDREATAFAIADNRTHEFAEWDEPAQIA